MRGFEIQLDVGASPPWSDMLTVSVGDVEMWSTGQASGHLSYVQEALLVPDSSGEHSQATVSYRDYNQPGQLAWISIQGQRLLLYYCIVLIGAFISICPNRLKALHHVAL